MKRTRANAGFAALFVLVTSLLHAAGKEQTALDRYIAKPDASYRYAVAASIPGEGYTATVLDMTSQTWRSAAEVDRTEWKHWVTIVKPAEVKTSTGFLFITGGANGGKPPAGVDAMLTSLAIATGSVTAELRMVPNQPLVFAGETRKRTEDSLIAYTWNKFFRGGDEEWPARLPMTKAAVRALDTITSFSASAQGGGVKVDRFVVSGGSKRGWTTWTTAAVDQRVVAIVPFVIDMLNIEKSMDHHFRAYGFWAPSIGDYTEARTMDWTGTPRYRELMKIEEPYSYLDRLTMPKFIVNASGDQFFLPDSSQFYFNDLKGEKYLRYVPNADHSLRKSDARESLQAFYESIVAGTPRPKFAWKFEKDGSIHVKPGTVKPSEMKLWQATNPKARDFRMEALGPVWTSTTLSAGKGGTYIGKATPPAAGWTGFFVELTYPTSGKYPMKFTTGVRVTPDTLPFASPRATPPI